MWQEHCSGSILSEEQDGEWGQGYYKNDDKWKRAMHVYSLAMDSEKQTPDWLMAISSVSGATLNLFFFWVKQSLHRPGQVLGLQEVEAPRISIQLAHKGGKVSTLHTSRH